MDLDKGHAVAVAALRLLRIERPDLKVVCLFAGSGYPKAELEIKSRALLDEADRRSFRFLGQCTVPELRSVYWASDLALLPSRGEGFGIAMVEAMCCGCVPIRTPGGGARDQIVEGETGFIVPFGDPAALARRITDLANPQLRARMREASIKHAFSKFGKQVAIERTAAVYQDAVLHRRRGWFKQPMP